MNECQLSFAAYKRKCVCMCMPVCACGCVFNVHLFIFIEFSTSWRKCMRAVYILYIHWMQSIHTWFHWLLVKIDAEVTLAKLSTFQVIILIDNETNITTKWVYRWNKATQIKCYQKLYIYLTPNQIKLLELNWNALSLSLLVGKRLFFCSQAVDVISQDMPFIHSVFLCSFSHKMCRLV